MSLKETLRKQEGFTLLELLIVIVIIAILALLIIPNITSAPKKARDTKRKTDITTLRKGLEEYFVNNNVYPNALSDLQAGSAPIVKTIPSDPKAGWPGYAYNPANSNSTYTISACLENDQDNGASTDTGSATGAPSGCSTRSFILVNGN